MEFDRDFVRKFLIEQTINIEDVDIFYDKNLIYDYNEVQELFFNKENYQVFLLGKENLNKLNMLKKIVFDIKNKGVFYSKILFLDMSYPILRSFDYYSYIDTNYNHYEDFFIIINEIQMLDNWKDFLKIINDNYPRIRLIASSSLATPMHEYFYDLNNEKIKIVVLSEKNESNIKSEQISFGVFNEFKYNLKNDFCEIKGLTVEGKLMKEHIVPSDIEGYPVKVIASGAFHHRKELINIVLPDSIEYIGDYAFTKCENLSSIKFPKNLRYIGDCAFLGSSNLSELDGGDKIEHIGNAAFYGTKWVTDNKNDFLVLGKTLYRFKGKYNDVILPNNIISLSPYCFAEADITTINLRNADSISEGTFYNCRNLSKVIGFRENKVKAFQFFNCMNLSDFPYSLSYVGKFGFYNCSKISKMDFLDADIRDNSFENCLSLKCITRGIEKVGKGSFYNTGLSGIDMRKIIEIGGFSFYSTRIYELNLSMVKSIGDFAFANIKTLNSVSINATAKLGKLIFYMSNNIDSASLGGDYYLDNYFGEKAKIKNLVINGSCINNISRDNEFLEKLEINCNRVGDWAFYNNSNLTKIDLNINAFGVWSFAYCKNIETVIIPETVEFIEMNAFRYCSSLKDVLIFSDSLVTFGPNAFYGTNSNVNFYVNSKDNYLNSDLWKNYKFNILEFDIKKTNLEISESAIYDAQYKNNLTIHELTIENSVKKIGLSGFEGCLNLKAVTIKSEYIEIDNWAFRCCKALEKVIIISEEIILNDGVFDNCLNLKTIEFHGKVKFAGSGIFKDCKKLTSITFNKGIDYFPDRTFANCFALEHLDFPDDLKKIGYKCFQNCKSLVSVVLPKQLNEIESKCFRFCSNLKYLFIPKSVKSIGSNVFDFCNDMTIFYEENIFLNLISKENKLSKLVLDKDFYKKYEIAYKEAIEVIGKTYLVDIDRPIGSTHPKHPEIQYPINYGFVKGLIGGDDEEQDVYVIDSKEILGKAEVKIIAIIFRQNDNETKWIGVANKHNIYTKKEILDLIHFQEQFYNSIVIKI